MAKIMPRWTDWLPVAVLLAAGCGPAQSPPTAGRDTAADAPAAAESPSPGDVRQVTLHVAGMNGRFKIL